MLLLPGKLRKIKRQLRRRDVLMNLNTTRQRPRKKPRLRSLLLKRKKSLPRLNKMSLMLSKRHKQLKLKLTRPKKRRLKLHKRRQLSKKKSLLFKPSQILPNRKLQQLLPMKSNTRK
jgi:hypothetical protein